MSPRALSIIRNIYVLVTSYLLLNLIMGFGVVKNYELKIRIFVLLTISVVLTVVVYLVFLKKRKDEITPVRKPSTNMILAYFYYVYFSFVIYWICFSLIRQVNLAHMFLMIILNLISVYSIIKIYITKFNERKLTAKTWIIMLLLTIPLFMLFNTRYSWDLFLKKLLLF